MRNRSLLLALPFLVVSLACITTAQIAPFAPCSFAGATMVKSFDGITVSRVMIVEPSGEVGATVIVPKSDGQIAGLVFTHSAIQGPDNRTDLLSFALAMARGGAASVVLDGDLDWKQANNSNARAPHLMSCAGQWLLQLGNIDPQRTALVGPHGNWGGGGTPLCLPGETPCWQPSGSLDFGFAGAAECANTDRMLTSDGQYRLAQFVGRNLKLGSLQPEWFTTSGVGE